MSRAKSSISQARSYKEIGEFWDTHDLDDFWDQTEPVTFEVDIRAVETYYPLERNLSAKLRDVAEARGISPETLLNLWVKEKLEEEANSTHSAKKA